MRRRAANGRLGGLLMWCPLAWCPLAWCPLAIVFTLVLAGCRVAGPAAPRPNQFDVSASEFKFEPRDIAARSGEITFIVRNVGAIEHNFVIEDRTGQTLARIATIDPGKSERLTVSLAPGAYVVACTYPGHREAGMVGSLTVTP